MDTEDMSDIAFGEEEECASNLTQPVTPFYIAGTTRVTGEPHVIKLLKSRKGWQQRRVAGDDAGLDVNYVSRESREQLQEWFACDFRNRFYTSRDLSDVLAYHHDSVSKVNNYRPH